MAIGIVRMEEIKKVYLDETLGDLDRTIRIMRILKYAYEGSMSEERRRTDNHIPAQFLTWNGEVREEEWKEHNKW